MRPEHFSETRNQHGYLNTQQPNKQAVIRMLKTTNEIGDIYGISTSYVRKLISRGVIKAKKVGGMYLIDTDKIAKIERVRQPPKRNRPSGLPKKANNRKHRTK